MFIELSIRSIATVHGYDDSNREVREEARFAQPIRKLVPLSRIQSVGDRFVLVGCAFGRQAYWEYVGDYSQVRASIESAGLLAAGGRSPIA